MENNLLIKHKRFESIGVPKKTYLYKFPHKSDVYFNFFNNYAKENYTLVTTNCLCHNTKDKTVSHNDRCGVEFHVVICENCGLIRAKKYYSTVDLLNFYKEFYRDIMTHTGRHPTAQDLYNQQAKGGIGKSKFIKSFITDGNTNLTILDLGGGVGGILEHFKNNNTCVLADYFDTYLNYAESQGIKTIKGGLREVNINPDVVILSHVIEHWNDFESEIQALIKIQKINQTLNYIEFPGVDSLKLGRRDADFLGDIHIPHMFYFSSYVFEDIMAMFGFKKIYLDSEIKGIFLYTGIKKQTNHNNYDRVVRDLLDAEKMRTKYSILSLIRGHLPKPILSAIRKIRPVSKTNKP